MALVAEALSFCTASPRHWRILSGVALLTTLLTLEKDFSNFLLIEFSSFSHLLTARLASLSYRHLALKIEGNAPIISEFTPMI